MRTWKPRRDTPSEGREPSGGQWGLQVPVMYSQHTQTVHARDTLAVPQQVAAVQARGEQELLPRLPADLAVIHSHRVHGQGTVAGKGRCCCCQILYHSEKAMTTHSSPLTWKIPWTEEPGRLQSRGLGRVEYD